MPIGSSAVALFAAPADPVIRTVGKRPVPQALSAGKRYVPTVTLLAPASPSKLVPEAVINVGPPKLSVVAPRDVPIATSPAPVVAAATPVQATAPPSLMQPPATPQLSNPPIDETFALPREGAKLSAPQRDALTPAATVSVTADNWLFVAAGAVLVGGGALAIYLHSKKKKR